MAGLLRRTHPLVFSAAESGFESQYKALDGNALCNTIQAPKLNETDVSFISLRGAPRFKVPLAPIVGFIADIR